MGVYNMQSKHFNLVDKDMYLQLSGANRWFPNERLRNQTDHDRSRMLHHSLSSERAINASEVLDIQAQWICCTSNKRV